MGCASSVNGSGHLVLPSQPPHGPTHNPHPEDEEDDVLKAWTGDDDVLECSVPGDGKGQQQEGGLRDTPSVTASSQSEVLDFDSASPGDPHDLETDYVKALPPPKAPPAGGGSGGGEGAKWCMNSSSGAMKSMKSIKVPSSTVDLSSPPTPEAVEARRNPEALCDAAEAGQLIEVMHLLHLGVDANWMTEDGWSCLLRAAGGGHVEIVSALLSCGAKVDLTAKDAGNAGGQTPRGVGTAPLWLAAKNGHADVVKALIAGGAKVDLASQGGSTPLYMAAFNGGSKVVKALLIGGAKVDLATKEGRTPLFTSAFNGHLGVVQTLLAAGAKVDLAQQDNAGPLFVASQQGHVEVVKALLAAGAKVDSRRQDGTTSLFVASQLHHVEVVKALLAHNATWSLARQDGETPLCVCIRLGHADLKQLLLAVGATLSPQANFSGDPFFWAATPRLPEPRETYSASPLRGRP